LVSKLKTKLVVAALEMLKPAGLAEISAASTT